MYCQSCSNVRGCSDWFGTVGSQPIRLSPAQRQQLAEKAKGIDPETLKRIAVIDFEDSAASYPDDASADSE